MYGTSVCVSFYFIFPNFTFNTVKHGRLTRSRLTAWNLGCGFAQNKEQLIVFRFLSGLGGSAALSVRIDPRVRPVQASFTRVPDLWRSNFRHMAPGGAGDGDGSIHSRAISGTRNWADGRCLDSREIEVAVGLLVD